jgi:hypothetical protein
MQKADIMGEGAKSGGGIKVSKELPEERYVSYLFRETLI